MITEFYLVFFFVVAFCCLSSVTSTSGWPSTDFPMKGPSPYRVFTEFFLFVFLLPSFSFVVLGTKCFGGSNSSLRRVGSVKQPSLTGLVTVTTTTSAIGWPFAEDFAGNFLFFSFFPPPGLSRVVNVIYWFLNVLFFGLYIFFFLRRRRCRGRRCCGRGLVTDCFDWFQ